MHTITHNAPLSTCLANCSIFLICSFIAKEATKRMSFSYFTNLSLAKFFTDLPTLMVDPQKRFRSEPYSLSPRHASLVNG